MDTQNSEQVGVSSASGSILVRKGHGALNDVVLVDGAPESHGLHTREETGAFVRTVCDRNVGFGGADGAYFIDRSGVLPIARYFNSDGSEAEYCGNGMRCVGRFLLEATGQSQATVVSGGTRFEVSELPLSDGGMRNVEVRAIDGLKIERDAVHLSIDGAELVFTLVLAPNPHLVAVVDSYSDDLLERAAEAVGREPGFEAGINVSFAIQEPLPGDWNWVVRTYERGAGLTTSCASGAVASAATLVVLGYAQPGEELYIRNEGGPIVVRLDSLDGQLFPTQSGNATWVFDTTVSFSSPLDSSFAYGPLAGFEDEYMSTEALYWDNANHLRRVGVQTDAGALGARANPHREIVA